jgi:hypothetical protein
MQSEDIILVAVFLQNGANKQEYNALRQPLHLIIPPPKKRIESRYIILRWHMLRGAKRQFDHLPGMSKQ